MKERIQKYMDFKNINAGELSVKLEVQRSNISHILNGRNKPSAAFIEKMLNVFQDLNARWLLTGEGNMTNTEEDVAIKNNDDVPHREENQQTINQSLKNEPTTTTKLPEEETTTYIPTFSDGKIDKIVIFYTDGTFSSFINRTKK